MDRGGAPLSRGTLRGANLAKATGFGRTDNEQYRRYHQGKWGITIAPRPELKANGVNDVSPWPGPEQRDNRRHVGHQG
jgi:hypothetical protein